MSKLDVLYIEPSWKEFSSWTYSEGKRVQLRRFASLDTAREWAKKHHFGVVEVSIPVRRFTP